MSQFTAQLEVEYYVDSVTDDRPRFEQAAKWIATRFQLPLLNVSISLVSDEEIREVNREQLQHDWSTDVISFVIETTDTLVDGEVIASADTASRLAPAAGWPPEDELLLYVVHGMLHVAGLEDIEEADRQAMRQAERECLLAMGIAHASQLAKNWDKIST